MFTIISGRWIEKREDGGRGSPCWDLEDNASGVVSYKVRDGKTCWVEITYTDAEGNYYVAKSDPIGIRSYEISINITGKNANNEIEAGDLLTLSYEVTGGREGFTVYFNWDLDLGGSYTTDTEKISSTERTGSV